MEVREVISDRQNTTSLRPRLPIRRFDVFAEYNRIEKERDGVPADEAAGYAIWVAKVVAGRRFGGGSQPGAARPKPGAPSPGAEPEERPHTKFRTLGDEPQTDETFEREIVRRMGERFYREVFSPAIARAVAEGSPYTAIRDSIRRAWNAEGDDGET
jgi:hypothetical protein